MKSAFRFYALGAAGAVTFFSACTLAPEYERPKSELPGVFSESAGGDGVAGTPRAADLPFRSFFKDLRLRKLIEIGLENNRDLRVAMLNVETVRERYKIQRSELLPTVSGNVSAERYRNPEALHPASSSGYAYTANQFNANVGLVTYEADFFGRVRSLGAAACAEFFRAEQNALAARNALIAEIATQYYGVRLAREQLELMRQSLETTRTIRNLVALRFERKMASKLEFAMSEAQFNGVAARVEELEENFARAKNALALLLGGVALPQEKDLPPELPFGDDVPLVEIAAGTPSEVLLSRPDVLAAEQALIAANADIGAARAAFFPRVALTGSLGLSSTEFDDLFSGSARTWSFAPSVSVPIFSGGRLKAELRVSELRKEIEIANYENAVQTAFREVADELAVQKFIGSRIAFEEKTLVAREERQRLSELAYTHGTGELLDVLLAQNDWFEARLSLAGSRVARVVSKINLYKALGGGFERTASRNQK